MSTVDAAVAEIRAHQAEHPGEEVCGFVLRTPDGFEVLRARNIAPDRARLAVPDAAALRAVLLRDVAYVYHSHPGGELPSADDQAACDAFGSPYLIVAPELIHTLAPRPPWSALIGLPWEWGVSDCVALCLRFAERVHGIRPDGALPEWPGEGWVTDGRDWFRECAERLGLVVLAADARLRFGDFLSYRIPEIGGERQPGENHLAVYLGDGRILHAVRGESSHEADQDERLLSYRAYVYRWRVLRDAG